MNHELFFERMAKDHMPKILGWAVKKTGRREEGQELTQEVFAQFLSAVSKEADIEKPENFLWKVAHYCWCHYLRNRTKLKTNVELDEAIKRADGTDFVYDLLLEETQRWQISKMRQEISNLSRVQREAMILHYLDGYSIAETAKKLDATESTVTWHLFYARKKCEGRLKKWTVIPICV